MTDYVTSVDGTRIAFERFGQGPPVVVVGGILCDRQATQQLAERLALQFSVITPADVVAPVVAEFLAVP